MSDLPARFWQKVDIADCWTWTGALSPAGYGRAWVDGQLQLPHRATYEKLVGPIPVGLTIDHLCRNRACVNPDHLEPVAQAENLRRGFRVKKTHCPQGHSYDERNTRVYEGRRYCRACHLIHSRAYKERVRA